MSQVISLPILPPALYVVAMPIGHRGDLAPRAIEVLSRVDIILAEDTRVSRQILKAVGILTRMISFNSYSEVGKTEKVIESLEKGQSFALISDAGTPAISDPGSFVIKRVIEYGYSVIPVPGPCALTAALSVSGFPAAPSHFFGFLPTRSSARDQELTTALACAGTLIIYEAPHRIVDLAKRLDAKAAGRNVLFARELTKTHEQLIRITAGQCEKWFIDNPDRIRGEFVVVLGPSKIQPSSCELETEKLLAMLARELPPSKAAALTSEITGIPKKKLYRQLTGKSEV